MGLVQCFGQWLQVDGGVGFYDGMDGGGFCIESLLGEEVGYFEGGGQFT